MMLEQRGLLWNLVVCFSLLQLGYAFELLLPRTSATMLSKRRTACVRCQSPLVLWGASRSMYSPRRSGGERSKRQERVGHLVHSELSRILHTGNIKGRDAEFLDDELRQRISIVKSDVSPDLRQARISISVRGSLDESRAVDRRRAFAWLVQNTKPIRHTLAQQLKHMKSCPSLTFVEVDVSAAVDVMALIDKVSSKSGYKRQTLDLYDPDKLPEGVVDGIDFDGDFEDDDWDDEEDEKFFDEKQ